MQNLGPTLNHYFVSLLPACTYANCGPNNPCHPSAACSLDGSLPRCTCPPGVPGNGWLCFPSSGSGNATLLNVGAIYAFTVPVYVNSLSCKLATWLK